MDRDDNIKKLRPLIPGLEGRSYNNDVEKFQSEVLRPIAKYQHTLIVKVFKSYLTKYKLTLAGKSAQDQAGIITHAMKTNKELKSFYQGLISSMMTDEEFDVYMIHRSEVNKRMTALLSQRLVSSL